MLVDESRHRFEQRFGSAPRAGARAPGRVNLIGEHTDYNQGLVLPCAIDRDCVAWVTPRTDSRVRVDSREQATLAEFDSRQQRPEARGEWGDIVQGIVLSLREAGFDLDGFDLSISSDVPVGAGLSSSAAVELAVVTALDACLGLGLQSIERARVAHAAETGFVGVKCGIMDPFTSALAKRGHALRIDCRDETIEYLPLPSERVAILVADSGVRRSLASGNYGDRVLECHDAFEAARGAGIGGVDARSLRDYGVGDLDALEAALPAVLIRRARHVITENARVELACEALRNSDIERLGVLLCQGMKSLQVDFDVTTPELDALCQVGDALAGCYGSRLTGAGFGGCTIHLVAPEAAEAVAAAIESGFEAHFGRRPRIDRVESADGAAPLE
ncbi:MAG: galactokinase [Myxococcales bacterium]|nr:galactokinase [Myxococcales bacterium]